MSIRLVNDAGEIFWFTGSNWCRLLRFAKLHGWPDAQKLDPDSWDNCHWNNHYEIVAGPRLDHEDAARLAAVIDQGIESDPRPQFMVDEFQRTAPEIRKERPEYDPLEHLRGVMREWPAFTAFARRSGFQVDFTD